MCWQKLVLRVRCRRRFYNARNKFTGTKNLIKRGAGIMAKMISDADKRQMLTGIREASQGFRKDLDVSRDTIVELANKAKYAHFDALVNVALGLYEGMAESLDFLDDTLTQMAELWLKQNVSTEDFDAWIKKFIDDRISLKVEYDTVATDDGNQDYSTETIGNPFIDEIKRSSNQRMQLLNTIQDEYQKHAGEDIADMIVGAFKKLEDSCNEFVVEFNKASEQQAALDSRLDAVANGIGELAANMKKGDMQENKKKKFGTVDASKYIDL